MTRNRHNVGGNLRCPHCNGTKPSKKYGTHNIKTNSNYNKYQCRVCGKIFSTIEILATEEVLRVVSHHKKMTPTSMLQEIYKINFNEFIQGYVTSESFKDYKDFMSKLLKMMIYVDLNLFTTHDLLPIDSEIQKFEDKSLRRRNDEN